MQDWLVKGARSRFGWFVGFCAICAFFGLAGCAKDAATVKTEGSNREELVRARSQARWDAILENRLTQAYGFFSAASRAVMSYEDYVRSVRVGFWKTAQVETVECKAEDACDAIVSIEYAHGGSRLRTPIRETWIQTEGNWWFVQK